ncbi:Uncharacterised protein [Vibrio cholerae]|nr:Uncharacterised protein [Vibrio cholerae]
MGDVQFDPRQSPSIAFQWLGRVIRLPSGLGPSPQ